MVLGEEPVRGGARAFCLGGEGGAAMLGRRVCDVVVTPCDVRSLEITRPRIDAILLPCQG
jgi:hypothetical protein